MTSPLSRAHRRFLGVTVPLHGPRRGDFHPLEEVTFTSPCRNAFQQHLSTGGRVRGGLLLGWREGVTLHICAVLPGGYGTLHPLRPHGQYVLGAVEAAQQVAGQLLDWVGNWVMPADGLAPDPAWNERLWHLAREHALVSSENILVNFGHSLERLEVQAWSEDNGKPLPLNVVWESRVGESL